MSEARLPQYVKDRNAPAELQGVLNMLSGVQSRVAMARIAIMNGENERARHLLDMAAVDASRAASLVPDN